ncbi:MAG: hypothetical protein UX42_C0007G0022 [Microgenomates group bacterium GW2011_GWC1_46_20]|nr:MAG: hypothetical protein UX42_C0007G0022 [Microgenomates group bacterium GW2011_GWC1_46_20]
MNTQGLMVKDLKQFLKLVIKPILNNPDSLRKSKKWKNIGLSSRECLGLFLICIAGRELTGEDWTISSDPETDDGIVVCRTPPREGEAFATEQTYVPSFTPGYIDDLVLEAIKVKSSRGSDYGKDRHLIIYCGKAGSLDLQLIKREIASNDIFSSFWVIARMSPKKWEFIVSNIKGTSDEPTAFQIIIHSDFKDWGIKSLGRL